MTSVAVVSAIAAAIMLTVGVASSSAHFNNGDFAGFKVSVTGTQTAGSQITVQIAAYDSDNDGDANYSGSKCVKFSVTAPANSPNGTPPSYPAPGSCGAGNSSLTFNSSFKATATVTLFAAQSAAKLTVTDVPTSNSGTSNIFPVIPGAAYTFSVPTPATQTAGTAFDETLTALDKWGNTATGYTGSQPVVFTGPHSSPNATPPAYPASTTFALGVGTATGIKLFDAESTTLTATQGAVTGTSGSFTVSPGTLIPAFAAQPANAQISTPIYSNAVTQAPVTVGVADAYGNLAPDGTAVTMTAPAGLGGTTSRSTTTGVASFNDLSLGAIGSYQLTALAGSQTALSNPFQIVLQLAVCNGSCAVTASNSHQSANSSLAAGSGSLSGVVLQTTFVGTPPPAGVCPGFTPLAGTVGTAVEVSGGNVSSSQPSLTVTFRIPRATFQAAGLNYLQALTLNICLGAQRYDGLTDPSHAWTTQSGSKATYDSGTGFYWGIVGDWPFWWIPNPNPHITARYVDLSTGDVVIVMSKPYPWDGWAYI